MTHWMKIPIGSGDYFASRDGEIFSTRTNTIMRQTVTHRNGYAYVKLYSKPYRAHRVILMAFEPCPFDGAHCCHINGVRTDNRVENLMWATAKENNFHKIAHGTLRGPNKGEKHHNAKLSDEHREFCKQLYESGFLQREIAERFGVHQATIHRILKGHDATQRQEMKMVRT